MGGKIKGITFDLWDTIVHDDSDEPKRKALGLRSKKAERRHLLWQALNAVAPIDPAVVTLAYDVADAAFNKTWHDCHVTWTIGERLQVALKGLNRTLPDEVFAETIDVSPLIEEERRLSERGIVMVDTEDPLCAAATLFAMEDFTILAMPRSFHRCAGHLRVRMRWPLSMTSRR